MTHSIVCDIWLYPCWECPRSLNEKKLAIAVRHFDPDIFVPLGQFTEEVHNDPFIFNGVAEDGATL